MTAPGSTDHSVGRAVVPALGNGFRLDIQALRAVAVVLVVAYHFWPGLVPGGYVGVDAFFVVSGFLITAHLVRELEATGTVSLARFWARRARRLLPASLTTLAIVAVLVLLLVPETLWSQSLREIAASTLYVENLALARDSIDYFAAENAASPVQHFWSLSTEEQFYAIWPLIIVAAAALSRVRGAAATRRAVTAALIVVTTASFVASIVLTASNAAVAYLISPTRAWEFGVGALLALAPTGAVRLGPTARSATAWIGTVVLVGTAMWFDEATAFPGWIAAVPVLATAAIIVAEPGDEVGSPMRLGRRRPVQFVGAVSYSWYLWHWPVLVLAPYAIDAELGPIARISLVPISLAAAWASLRWVENPLRSGARTAAATPRIIFTASLVAMSAVLTLTWVGNRQLDQLRASALDAVTETPTAADCFGAAALDPAAECDLNGDGPLVPDPLVAKEDAVQPACMVGVDVDTVRVCEFGSSPESSATTVALIGDSHAGHWRATIDALAERHNWRILTMLKGSCPFTTERRRTNDAVAESCEAWNRAVVDEIAARPEISIVFVSGSSKNEFVTAEGSTSLDVGARGHAAAWASLPDTVQHVVALRDIPRPRPDNVDCLQELGSDTARRTYAACGLPRSEAVLDDPIEVAATTTTNTDDRVIFVDTNDRFCDDDVCFAAVGNVTVYRDGHHMTATFARTLAPVVDASLTATAG